MGRLDEAGIKLLRLWAVTNPWADRRYYDCLDRDEFFGVDGHGVCHLWHLPERAGVGCAG